MFEDMIEKMFEPFVRNNLNNIEKIAYRQNIHFHIDFLFDTCLIYDANSIEPFIMIDKAQVDQW